MMTFRTAACVVGAISTAAPISGQQILEVLVDSGRTIVGGIEYDFGHVSAIDPIRGIIYVAESLDRYVVEARSLHDGSVIGRYGRGRGDGPGEVQTVSGIAADSAGVFVADRQRINYWLRSSGELGFVWTPEAPSAHRVCSFGGQPAVPLHPNGVAVRNPDGSSRAVGTDRVSRNLRVDQLPGSDDEFWLIADQFRRRRLACTTTTAYILGEDDVLTAFLGDGTSRQIPMPAELVEQARKRRESGRIIGGYRNFTLDSNGHLFVPHLFVPKQPQEQVFSGAIIDPETGDYTLLQDNARHPSIRWYVGMYRDSVVATRAVPSVETIDGRQVTVLRMVPSHISIYPLRPITGPEASER